MSPREAQSRLEDARRKLLSSRLNLADFQEAMVEHEQASACATLAELIGEPPEVAPGCSAKLVRGFALFEHAKKQAAAWMLQAHELRLERDRLRVLLNAKP